MFGTMINRIGNPLEELWTLDRVFNDILSNQDTGYPKTEAWVKDDKAQVVVELPGVESGIEPGSVEVSVEGDLLSIKGQRKALELAEGETYTRRERWHGAFNRTLKLPFRIEQGKVEAKFANGILSITLPKAEEEKPKKITITA